MERQASLLARRLAARGHTVHVLSHEHRDASWRAALPPPPERREAFVLHRVPLLRGMPAEAARELASLMAAGRLRRARPDALLAIHISSCPMARDLALLLGVPWAVKLAGGGSSGDITATQRSGDPESRLHALRAAERVVCVSAQIEDEVRAAGVAPGALVRLPNGVDAAALAGAAAARREALGLAPDTQPLLFVGRLDEGKLVDVLLRGLVLLRARQPRACLLVAGTGPAEPSLRRLAQELGLAAQVSFLGQRDDVPCLLKLARALVLPSQAEGMSNAVLEAMAAGTPVVATRIPANEGLVGEDSGWLVPVHDAEALACALEQVLSDPGEAAARAARAARRVAERFDIDAVAAGYERLLAALPAQQRSWVASLGALRCKSRSSRAWAGEQVTARLRRAVSEVAVGAKRFLL